MSFSSLRSAAGRTSVAAAYAASALLLVSGCGGEDLAPGASAGTRTSSSTAAVTGSTCQSAGPHQKHVALGFSCETCHPCANDYGFGSFTFPGGTTTDGGTMTRSGGSTTCSVGCHSPFGAPAQPIAWDAGPLECTSCHSGATTPPGGIVSSHGDAAMTNCTECHDQTRHTKGEVILFPGNGPGTTATCIGCHSGQGQTLGGRTPPLLVGWTDTVNGDFHGARLGTCQIDRHRIVNGQAVYQTEYYQPCGSAGPNDRNVVPTGFGGSLKAPFARNQDPLECEDCHGVHASSNSFLLAAVVNDTVIPPGAIDRAGVGAETLCNACHQGDRHEACKSCHREGIIEDWEGFRWFDPETPVVDPAPDGTACFLCHGHEGIQNMADFFPETPDPRTFQNPHHTWLGNSWWWTWATGAPAIKQGGYSYAPAPYYLPTFPRQPTPPVFLYPGGTVFDVTATTASIYWETNEGATSYVAYGVGTAGYVTGFTPFSYVSSDPSDPARRGTHHRIDLTGLEPDTTYVWRIFTSDAHRNLTEGPLQTFRTTNPDGPPAPALVRLPDQYDSGGSGNYSPISWPASQPLTWNPVTSPAGNPVEYRMQLGTDHTFASFAVDTGWTIATSHPLTLTSELATCTQWYWRVMARDAVTGEQSIWSTETYSVCVGDPYNDY